MNEAQLNLLSHEIIGAAIDVHKTLGPGLLEHTYQVALMHELGLRKVKAECEVWIPLIYKGVKLDAAYKADIIVANEIIVELKATENENPLFLKQLYTYLRLADKKLGLLINFNRERLTEGLKRVVNNI